MVLCSNHDPGFASIIMLEWAVVRGLRNPHIEPGKSWQNSTMESFNGKFRDECLAMSWLDSAMPE